jgi:putative FmdB family regulatory protein
MPIYEYKCDKCGVVEVMQGIKEKPLKKCPNCKSKVERQISSTSFVLKGSGWYATDYAKKTAPPTDTSSAANGTNGDAKASEASKPATDKSAASTEKSASTSETKSSAASEKATKPASSAKSAASTKSD